MEDEFVWRDSYNVGVESIDRDHQRLFNIINKLRSYGEEKGRWVCQEGVKYFRSHALKHFSDEESYMASIHYPDLKTHCQIHRDFRERTLPALEEELKQTNYAPETVEHFLGVCAGWLIGHTLTEDQAITKGTPSKWKQLLPEEEQAAVKKIIIQLLFDMFHLESDVISESYGGEKFGRGVYYRLVYGSHGGAKQQEIVMAFEERLLVNTVGKIIGLQTNKLDNMLVNAARYTAKQFVGRVLEQLPDDTPRNLLEENLLTYNQFRHLFEKETPQISLLLNAGGAGYFAYCAIAPHLLESGIGDSIKESSESKDALKAVESYLEKREERVEREASKRRVLVVDDSMTIRESIRRLLQEDYDVSVVESGVAAIRAITLSRPDLVLLDYEMPICDGRQTLEMLRSEQSFNDVPVIFLTGRSDPEIVRSLLALKPAGYLLKYLKPAEIKSKIDDFFAKRGL